MLIHIDQSSVILWFEWLWLIRMTLFIILYCSSSFHEKKNKNSSIARTGECVGAHEIRKPGQPHNISRPTKYVSWDWPFEFRFVASSALVSDWCKCRQPLPPPLLLRIPIVVLAHVHISSGEKRKFEIHISFNVNNETTMFRSHDEPHNRWVSSS